MTMSYNMMIGMIFTTVLQWNIFIASNNDLDDQNLLLATVPTVEYCQIIKVSS
jgi:hypothetical protein